MSLRRQLAQCSFSVFLRIALGAESGIAQARTPVFKSRTVTEAPSTIIATRTPAAAVIPTRLKLVVARTATTRRVLAITKLATTSGHDRRFFSHARSVVAAHRHHRLSDHCGLGWLDGGFCSGRCIRGIGSRVSGTQGRFCSYIFSSILC